MRRVDRLKFHQLSDRILPACRLPDEDDRNERTTGGGGKLGEAQEAAPRLRELHVGPEPTAKYADAVTGRQRKSQEHALPGPGLTAFRPYCISRARSRANSASLIDPACFSRLSFSISSATLKPTTLLSSSRACRRSAMPLP